MPYFFLAIGAVLVAAAYHNTLSQLGATLKNDFIGENGFIYWVAAIIIVGAIGYIKPAQSVSRAFLVLIIIMVVLTNGGVWSNLVTALDDTVKSGAGTGGGSSGGGGW